MPKRSKKLVIASSIIKSPKKHETSSAKWVQWVASLILLVGIFGITAYPVKRIFLLCLGKNCDYKKMKLKFSVDGIQAEWGYSGLSLPPSDFLEENSSEPPVENANIYGGIMKINGQSFLNGFGVRAPSELAFSLNGKISRFSCLVGFDMSSPGDITQGGVFCSLLADGHEIFKSHKFDRDFNPIPIDVSVVGVKELILKVDIPAIEQVGSDVDWVNLSFKP